MKQIEIYNAAKEVSYILEYMNPEITMKIPESFILKLKDLSLNATEEVKLDFNKKLEEQNISETAKDLLALIYYSYIATEDEKKELKESWNKNIH